jgi:hypothetical protein
MILASLPRLRQGVYGASSSFPGGVDPDDPTEPPPENFVSLVSIDYPTGGAVSIDPDDGAVWSFSVDRSGSLVTTAIVSWEAVLGTGMTSADLTVGQAMSGTLTFAPTETTKSIPFSAPGSEGSDAVLTLTLSGSQSVQIEGPASVSIQLLRQEETPTPPDEDWPDPPILLLVGANRVAVDTAAELATAVAAVSAGKQIVLTNNIATTATLTFSAIGTEASPVVLRGDNASDFPQNWRVLRDATINIRGSRLIITNLVLNNCKIFFGQSTATASRYHYNRITRTVHTGGTGGGKRDACITVGAGGRYIRIDHNQFGKYGTTSMRRSGIVGDQATLSAKLIEEILPVGTTPYTAWPGPARTGSITAPTQNNYSENIQVDYNLFSEFEKDGTEQAAGYGLFTGQDNGESHLPSRWDIHHNLFRKLQGGSARPWIENKNSYTTIRNNTFERVSASDVMGHVRLRHGDNNTIEENVFVARGAWLTGEIQVRGDGNTIINNQSVAIPSASVLSNDDKIILYSGGLDAIFWPTRTGQATGDSSYQIASLRCSCGGNKMVVEYGENNGNNASQMGVPARLHSIGAGSGGTASRNQSVAAASGFSSPTDYDDLTLSATVTDANYALADLTILTTSDVGVAAD